LVAELDAIDQAEGQRQEEGRTHKSNSNRGIARVAGAKKRPTGKGSRYRADSEVVIVTSVRLSYGVDKSAPASEVCKREKRDERRDER
jgi:hypothetical protein